MARGDLISIPCVWGFVPYRHFGIDMGDGTVIHLATHPSQNQAMQVHRVSWDLFRDGKSVRIEQVSDGLDADEVTQRACRAVGRSDYHLVLGNCEHFARSCKSGRHVSHQADRLVRGAMRTGVATLISFSKTAATAAVVAGLPQRLVTKSAGIASLFGEAARHSAYIASRCSNIEHRHADRIGKSAGVTAAAIAGLATAGPVGGIASAALYLSIDAASQSAFQKWAIGKLNDQAPPPQ